MKLAPCQALGMGFPKWCIKLLTMLPTLERRSSTGLPWCCCVTLLLLHKHAPAEPAMDPTAPSIASIPEDDGVNSTAGEKLLVAWLWLNEHTFLTFVPSCRNQQRQLLSTTTRPTNSRPVPARPRQPGRQNNASHPHHNQLRVPRCRRWSSYRLHLRNLRSSLFHTPSVSTCV